MHHCYQSPSRLPPPMARANIPPGARQTPPTIGLQIHSSPQPSLPQLPNSYEPEIMHRPILPTLHQVTIIPDASISSIASAFNIPVAVVAANWLTSRSPMELPGFDRSLGSRNSSLRRQPPPLSPTCLDKCRTFAISVCEKLAPYVVAGSHHQKDGKDNGRNIRRVQRPSRKILQKELDNIGLEPSRPNVAEARRKLSACNTERPTCGYAKLATHASLQLNEGRRVATKTCAGLYRVAMACGLAKGRYAEFEILEMGGQGGLAVGVAPLGHPLNRLAGSDQRSVGLHGSGMIVMENAQWRPVGNEFEKGDVIGVCVYEIGRVDFWMNGTFLGQVEGVNVDALRFVTCLYREGAKVRFRCCATEWQFFERVAKQGAVLKHSCGFGVEELEANMSSTSAASGSEAGGAFNRASPGTIGVQENGNEDKIYGSCESVLTP